MLRSRYLACILTLVASVMLCGSARADTPAPWWSYAKPAPGGKFLFVQIGGGIFSRDRNEPDESKAIRQRYAKSGLYRADDSTEPLWTLPGEGYRYEGGIDLASDGVHCVCSSGPTLPESGVLWFYANGELLRTYRGGDLVDDLSQFPRSATWVRLGAITESRLDDEHLQYIVETGEGNRIVFDVRTGEIISDSRTARFWKRVGWWVGGITAGFVVIALCFRLIRRLARNPIRPPRPIPNPWENG